MPQQAEETSLNNETKDRVRANTSAEVNARLDGETVERLRRCATAGEEEISSRIEELEREWDIERYLSTNASVIAFAGVILAALHSIYWLIVPGVVLPFLFLHAVQGWCPPLPIFRRRGVRTRKEIERERYALKVLRGDFSRFEKQVNDDDRAQSALNAVSA